MDALFKLIVLLLIGGVSLVGFLTKNQPPDKPDVSLAGQAATRVAGETVEPNEIEAIDSRRGLMGKPALQFYVIFLAGRGQPIDYFVTKGKCASSGKRLTKQWQFQEGQTGVNSDGYAVYGDFVLPAPDIDGTYGTSEAYIFCFTVDGRYKQWNGKYYISDRPIELTVKSTVVAARN